MRRRDWLLAGGALVLAMPRAGAQAAAAGIPPIRPIGRILKVAPDSLSYIASIRVLSDGRVLANDTRGRRVVLYNAGLTRFEVVADTLSATARAYGESGGWLLPFVGDSSLFADFAALAFLVIDPAGKIVRKLAAPLGPNQALSYLASSFVDPMGNILSRQTRAGAASMGRQAGGPAVSTRITGNGSVGIGGMALGSAVSRVVDSSDHVVWDSTVVLRKHIDTKQLDTLAWLMAAPVETAPTIGPGGAMFTTTIKNLLPVSDAWVMLPDGGIAAIREHDYHIDWVAPDSRVTSTPKIPHEWRAFTDSAKRVMIDSARQADSLAAERARPRLDSVERAASASRMQGMVSRRLSGGIYVPSGGAPLIMPSYQNPDNLPSYYPPFVQREIDPTPALADADGNIWIHVALPDAPPGGIVYDVVNRRGTLIERIQIPGGTHLVGFGPGVAYLISRMGARYSLARVRIH